MQVRGDHGMRSEKEKNEEEEKLWTMTQDQYSQCYSVYGAGSPVCQGRKGLSVATNEKN